MDIWHDLESFKSDEIDRSPLLYHYTTLDAFCNIIADDGDLYCTHFNALNDDAELLMGEKLFERYLMKRLKWGEDKCRWFGDNYKNIVKVQECVVPWLMSFSRDGDSLGQWVAYTDRDKGGVAIGFNREKILGAIDRKPGCYGQRVDGQSQKADESSFELHLSPCLYAESDADLVNKLFGRVFMNHAGDFKRLASAITDGMIGKRDFMSAVYAILEVSSVIKHHSFENEHEERLVLLPKTTSCSACVMLGGKPRWRTHIADTTYEGYGNPKYKGIRGMVQEIVISPHGDREMLMTSVKVLRNKYKMDFCKIRESKSPYNGR